MARHHALTKIQRARRSRLRRFAVAIDPIWGHLLLWAMADLKVRQLDDQVANALRARAERHGVSLEEEVRGTLAASVEHRRRAFLRRAAAIRKTIGVPAPRSLDSTRIIRRERDKRG
jgi:plasmid stability protein